MRKGQVAGPPLVADVAHQDPQLNDPSMVEDVAVEHVQPGASAQKQAQDPLDDIVNDHNSADKSPNRQESLLSDPTRSPGKFARAKFERSSSQA